MEDAWTEIIALENRYWEGPMSKTPVHWSNALAGEGGEVCNDVKHRAGGGSHQVTVNNAKVLGELGDTVGYLVTLSARVGWDAKTFALAVHRAPAGPLDTKNEVQLANRLAACIGWVCHLTDADRADEMAPDGESCYAIPRVARAILNLAWRSLGVNYEDFLASIGKMIAKNDRRMSTRKAGSAGNSHSSKPEDTNA